MNINYMGYMKSKKRQKLFYTDRNQKIIVGWRGRDRIEERTGGNFLRSMQMCHVLFWLMATWVQIVVNSHWAGILRPVPIIECLITNILNLKNLKTSKQ